MNLDAEESLRFFATLRMTKGGGLAVKIRVAKRPQLLLLLLYSLFLLKCLCALTYLVSFGKQPDEGAYEGKAYTKSNGSGPK